MRILGINAPQKERPTECYAAEATADVKRLLPSGTTVLYKLGVTGDDKFGRALAYVWTRSGVFVAERIVEAGDATFSDPPRKKGKQLTAVEKLYVERLRKAQVRAEMARRGVWRVCSAAGD